MDEESGPGIPVATPAQVASLRQAIGARLRLGRQAAGIRQADLGERTGYTRSSIAHIESGRQRAPLSFWQQAEALLGATTRLVEAFHELVAAEAALQVADGQARQEAARRQLARLEAARRPADESASVLSFRGRSASAHAASSAGATLRWLVAPPVVHLAKARGSRRVGQADVARLQAARRQLKATDDSLGGRAAYPMAREYLKHEALPLLDGSYTDQAGRDLYDVLAQLTLDLGWMAYDGGQQAEARQHMLRALDLARAGQHRLFGGRVLAALSHQALHLGRVSEAVDLASAALIGTEHVAPPAATAMFAAMQACAAAAQDDRGTCEAALNQAERALDVQADNAAPAWLDFDEGGLAGHAARAYRDLGLPNQARSWAETAIARCKVDHSRTRAQREAILATVLVQAGELEQAAHVANEVVTAARHLHSTHVVDDVASLVRLIDPSRSAATFRFVSEARDYLAAQPPAGRS